MKALLCREFGLPDTLRLEEVAPLTPQKNEIIIEMRACSVNFPDTLIIQNRYQFKPALPFSPGGEVAGVIKALGSDVKHFSIGDAVLALCGWGGFAEEVAVDASKVFPIPPEMDFITAASVMYNYGTSYHALKDRANLQKGETLLVLGAGGGVGLAAVELGKLMGATVIAAASSDEKLTICNQKGADFVINYTSEDLKESIRQLTNGEGVNVIYDPVGSQYAEPALRSMAWKGRYLVVGFAGGEIPKLPFNLALLKGCSIVGIFWGRFATTEPQQSKENLFQLANFFRKGLLRPHIYKTYSLENAKDALNDLMQRKVIGKAVVVAGGLRQALPDNELEPNKNCHPVFIEGNNQQGLRQAQPDKRLHFKNLADFKAHEGQSLGTTEWLTVSQEMINQFAETTRDKQWIHVDTEKAALSPLGSTIAHGLLTLSLTPYLVGQLYTIESLTMGINYGMDKVRFLKPIPTGSAIRLKAHIKSIEDFGAKGMKVILEATIQMQDSEKPVCYTELISVLYEK